jgi:hypothetical protein
MPTIVDGLVPRSGMIAAAAVYLGENPTSREKIPSGRKKITWDKITFPPRTESKEGNGKSFGSR